MTKPEDVFHRISKNLSGVKEGKMFGALSIKTDNGKNAAILWQGCMIFKLDENSQQEALKLDGSKVGSHLYAPERPMNGWISLPVKYSEKWQYFAEKAVAFVMIP